MIKCLNSVRNTDVLYICCMKFSHTTSQETLSAHGIYDVESDSHIYFINSMYETY